MINRFQCLIGHLNIQLMITSMYSHYFNNLLSQESHNSQQFTTHRQHSSLTV